MRFNPPLEQGLLLRRYKRFLADILDANGLPLTLHCPNTGSMRNCGAEGSRVWYSRSGNAARKLPGTWEMVESADGHLVGINTGRANDLVQEALEVGILAELRNQGSLRREVRYGREGSRIDFLLAPGSPQGESCYLEVKNLTLGTDSGTGMFPDAVTERGHKHLRELVQVRRLGSRAVLLFCVQHTGILRVRPADEIDPEYGRLLRWAAASGVEVLAYRASLSPEDISLADAVAVELD